MNISTLTSSFRFEQDFVEEGMRCIPMMVRFNLDNCGVKLKLSEWSRLSEDERTHLAEVPCSSGGEIATYRAWLRTTVLDRCGSFPADLPFESEPLWAEVDEVPAMVQEKLNELNQSMTISEWAGLSDLQRFALVKLSRPGHENRNFPLALIEFRETSPY
jgi:hypothetical protein